MKYIVLDIETTGLSWKRDRLHGIALHDPKIAGSTYLQVESPEFQPFLSILQDPTIAKVGHNLRFDLRFLSRLCKVEGPLYDTMLMAQLVDENNSVGLKQLAERYLGKAAVASKAELDSLIGRAGLKHVGELCAADLSEERSGWFFDRIAKYAIEDVENTAKLFKLLGGKLRQLDANWREIRGVAKTPLDYLAEEAAAVEPALLAMELRGILLSPAAIEKTQWQVSQDLSKAETDIEDLCSGQIDLIEETLYEKEVSKRKSEKGKAKVQRSDPDFDTCFSLSSSQHVATLIYGHLDAPAEYRTSSGLYSTNEADLGKLRAEVQGDAALGRFLDLFSEYRRLQKLWTTYVAPDSGLLEHATDQRVHSLYLQAGSSKDGGKGGTATGRLSSQSPNMQNLPRNGGIRKFFVPDPGYVFVYADYSQVELRIAAHLSQDQALIQGYQDKLDLHAITASNVFRKPIAGISKEERQVGKTLNFALIYDASAWRLEQELGPLGYSVEDCEAMRRAFFAKYEGYDRYLKVELGKLKDMKMVISETGRVRRLPEVGYGTCLEWRGKQFKGTQEQFDALRNFPSEILSNSEAFERARKKYRHAIKQAYNFPIQSLSASITKRALATLCQKGYDLVTSVHDSIVVQVPLASAKLEAKLIQKILEQNYTLSIPLVADTKILTSLEESDILSIEDEESSNTQEKVDENPRNSNRSETLLASNTR